MRLNHQKAIKRQTGFYFFFNPSAAFDPAFCQYEYLLSLKGEKFWYEFRGESG